MKGVLYSEQIHGVSTWRRILRLQLIYHCHKDYFHGQTQSQMKYQVLGTFTIDLNGSRIIDFTRWMHKQPRKLTEATYLFHGQLNRLLRAVNVAAFMGTKFIR